MREYGSLGCSGDLAPLAHCALAAMGEGEVRVTRARGALRARSRARRSQAAGIEPVVLAEKEGLALINGTDGMLGMLVLAATDLRALLKTADITAAMSVEALLGTDAAFAADLQALRPHPGQAASAANFRALLALPRSSPATRAPRTPACRTPTACAAPPRCTAPRATPSSTPRRSRAASWPARSTTPWSRSTAGW